MIDGLTNMARYILFLLTLLAGLGAGLFYGWVLSPVEFVDTSPDTLRQDYKTDYVLMAAEAYSVEGDVALAARRLALLGDETPFISAQQALTFAVQVGYAPSDLALLRELVDALETWNPSLGTGND